MPPEVPSSPPQINGHSALWYAKVVMVILLAGVGLGATLYFGLYRLPLQGKVSLIASTTPDTSSTPNPEQVSISSSTTEVLTTPEVVSQFNSYAKTWGIKGKSSGDHIYGNVATAKFIILTYGDLESEFTFDLFHSIFSVVDMRNDTIWIYRHFPLERIHSKAMDASTISECVARLSSNATFWEYVDYIMRTKTYDLNTHIQAAAEAGITQQQLLSCWGNLKVIGDIDAQIAEATSLGAQGVPYSRIISSNGQMFIMEGSFDVDRINSVLDALR